MKNTIKILAISFFMSATTATVTFFLLRNDEKKIAVIDAVKLVNGYNMKIELEKRAKAELEKRGRRLDTLNSQLQLARAGKDEKGALRIADIFKNEKAGLDGFYRETNQFISQEVWKKLNPMLTDYGKVKKVHLIIGANGMGTVLYNDDYCDLTDDAIKYINKRYEEGN